MRIIEIRVPSLGAKMAGDEQRRGGEDTGEATTPGFTHSAIRRASRRTNVLRFCGIDLISSSAREHGGRGASNRAGRRPRWGKRWVVRRVELELGVGELGEGGRHLLIRPGPGPGSEPEHGRRRRRASPDWGRVGLMALVGNGGAGNESIGVTAAAWVGVEQLWGC